MLQIPLPRMVGHHARMVACQAIHHPIRRCYMRIVKGAVYCLRRFLIPTRPALPIQIIAVIAGRHLVWLIVKEALANAILLRSIAILEMPPQDSIDELLQLADLFFVRLSQFFHGSSKPRVCACLITQARDPHAAILHHLLICLAVVAYDSWPTMKWVGSIGQPLFRCQKAPKVRNCFSLRLNDTIADCLQQAVGACNGDSCLSPCLSPQLIALEATRRLFFF